MGDGNERTGDENSSRRERSETADGRRNPGHRKGSGSRREDILQGRGGHNRNRIHLALERVLMVRAAARQAHRKDRAFARLARHCHIATHHARELARDSEPEPGAAEALSGRGIGLAEFLEQLDLLLRRHANAGVGDGELDEVAAIAHLA
jgi:hypothetical protein